MRDLLIRIGARVLASLLQAATLLLLARWLGADVFGKFGVSISFGLLAGSFLGFGTTTLVLRIRAYQSREELFLSQIDILRLLSTLMLVIVSIGVTWFLGLGFFISVFAGFYVAGDFLNEYLQSRCAGQDQQIRSVAVILWHRLVILVCGLIMYSDVLGIGVEIACCLAVVEFLIQTAVLLVLVRKWRLPDLTLMSELCTYWGASIAGSLRQLEVPVVTMAYSSGAGGTFVLASRIVNPLLIVTSSMQAVFVPKLSRMKPADREYKLLFKRIRLIGSGYAALLVLTAPLIANILVFFAGETYRAYMAVIYAAVISVAICAIANVWQIGLYATGHPRPIAYGVALSTILGLGLYTLFGAMNVEAGLYATPIIVQLVQSVILFSALTRLQRGNQSESGDQRL